MSRTRTLAPPAERHTTKPTAVLCGVGAYVIWGLVPLYFKQVASIPPLAILAHRIVWSVLFLAILVTIQRLWTEVIRCFRSRTLLLMLAGSTFAVAINWFTFIFAISTGRILQSSLGYFVTPLVNVALGVIVLGERLRRWQIVGLLLAAVGVVVQILATRSFPWIALLLAASFSSYALLRKQMGVGPLIGGIVETMLLLPFGMCVAIVQARHDVMRGRDRFARLRPSPARRPRDSHPVVAVRAGSQNLAAFDDRVSAIPLADRPVPAGGLRLSRTDPGAEATLLCVDLDRAVGLLGGLLASDAHYSASCRSIMNSASADASAPTCVRTDRQPARIGRPRTCHLDP